MCTEYTFSALYNLIRVSKKHNFSDCKNSQPYFLLFQALILKLKDPDPNPAVVISVLATIGELAQVRLDFREILI